MFAVDTLKKDESISTFQEAYVLPENFSFERAEQMLGLSAPLLAYVERSDRMSLLDNSF